MERQVLERKSVADPRGTGISRLSLALWFVLVAMIVNSAAHDKPVAAALVAQGAGRGAAAQGERGPFGAPSADAAVRRSYEALASEDMPRFAEALDPSARAEPAQTSALSVALQFSQIPAETLASIAFAEMRYQVTRDDGTWAEVRVRGLVRNAALGTEVPMDAIEVAHQVEEGWYISVPELYQQTPAGQEYAARIQRLNAEGCH